MFLTQQQDVVPRRHGLFQCDAALRLSCSHLSHYCTDDWNGHYFSGDPSETLHCNLIVSGNEMAVVSADARVGMPVTPNVKSLDEWPHFSHANAKWTQIVCFFLVHGYFVPSMWLSVSVHYTLQKMNDFETQHFVVLKMEMHKHFIFCKSQLKIVSIINILCVCVWQNPVSFVLKWIKVLCSLTLSVASSSGRFDLLSERNVSVRGPKQIFQRRFRPALTIW